MGIIILKFVRAKLQWTWRLKYNLACSNYLKIATISSVIGVWVFQGSLVTDHWMWPWKAGPWPSLLLWWVSSHSASHWIYGTSQLWLHLLSRGTGSSRRAHGHNSGKQPRARAILSYSPNQHYRSEVCPRNTEMCHLLRMRFRKIMVTKIEPFYSSWDHSPTYQVWDRNW